MGSDLVGFVLVGPRLIGSQHQRRTAEAKVEELLDQLRAGGPEYFDASTQHLEDYGDCPETILERLVDPFRQAAPPATVDTITAKQIVDAVIDCWCEKDYIRDLMSKAIGTTRKVIVVGGDSCGDEPDGYGYQVMRLAAICDLFDIFKIT